MSKIPKTPSEIFNELVNDYKSIFGNDLLSVILYGSAARGEYQYKKSDINFLITLTEQGIENLSPCLPLIIKWKKHNVSTPLFLTKDYIISSLDAFPIEFFGMKRHYQVVFGEDVFQDVQIQPEHLRLQCEREMKGKLLHLRESFLNFGASSRFLTLLLRRSIDDFSNIFIALLKLKQIDLPQKRNDIISETAKAFHLDQSIFEEIIAVRDSQKKLSKKGLQTLTGKYIHEIRNLTSAIDSL